MKTTKIATCIVGNIKLSLCEKGNWKLGHCLDNKINIPKCMCDRTQQLCKVSFHLLKSFFLQLLAQLMTS